MTDFKYAPQVPYIFGIDFFFSNASVGHIRNLSPSLKTLIAYTDLHCATWKIYSDEYGVTATAMHEPHFIDPSIILLLVDLVAMETTRCVSLYNQTTGTHIEMDGIEFYCRNMTAEDAFGSANTHQIWP
ncbi:hypothetical protein [Novosphingobium arvoryzae]|uniref:Uncharacterized protein n=1 Tax=Novosphingobium arvoryzae TaxID=1256514 RepID=A0A918RAS1_9SPHN|nr:hypothetical protein [Novosphingobium arvoryzae]GGZ90514.1 hypothetical protein GCM10011617_06820 [Novosphingobium arvoryzae]